MKITATRLEELAALLDEYNKIRDFLRHSDSNFEEFSLVFGEIHEVDDDGDGGSYEHDIEPFECGNDGAVDCTAVAWDAIVSAYKVRVLVIENTLCEAGITGLD